MSFPGILGPAIIIERINEVGFMQIQGGMLYGIRTTGQIEYFELMFPKGLKPSLANARRTLCRSREKSGYRTSNDFHALASLGWLYIPSELGPLLCHSMSTAVLLDIYNLCNRGIREK
ncbi:hypothetical protein AAHE18_18G132100 [Arachis hypogaea]